MTKPAKRYLPAEDTVLLRDALRDYRGRACLEIGFGSGAVLRAVGRRFGLAVGTEIQGLEVAKSARGNGFDLVVADGAACFREDSFDLVFFNPPYLPSSKIEDTTTDGGPTGVEVPCYFLEQGLRVLRQGGALVTLLSWEGDVESFLHRAEKLGLKVERISSKRLFYETLEVYRFERAAHVPRR